MEKDRQGEKGAKGGVEEQQGRQGASTVRAPSRQPVIGVEREGTVLVTFDSHGQVGRGCIVSTL